MGRTPDILEVSVSSYERTALQAVIGQKLDGQFQKLLSEYERPIQQKLFDLLGSLDDSSCLMLLEQTVTDLRNCLKGIEKGLSEKAPNYVASMAHQLKSVSGTFGLTLIQELSYQTNEHWKNGLVEETLNAGHVITDTLPKGIQMIEDIANSYKPEGATT